MRPTHLINFLISREADYLHSTCVARDTSVHNTSHVNLHATMIDIVISLRNNSQLNNEDYYSRLECSLPPSE